MFVPKVETDFASDYSESTLSSRKLLDSPTAQALFGAGMESLLTRCLLGHRSALNKYLPRADCGANDAAAPPVPALGFSLSACC